MFWGEEPYTYNIAKAGSWDVSHTCKRTTTLLKFANVRKLARAGRWPASYYLNYNALLLPVGVSKQNL